MKIIGYCLTLGLCLSIMVSCSQQNRVNLGTMRSVVRVSFVNNKTGDWEIEISSNTFPHLINQKPEQIEVFQDENYVTHLAVVYQSVQKRGRCSGSRGKGFRCRWNSFKFRGQMEYFR